MPLALEEAKERDTALRGSRAFGRRYARETQRADRRHRLLALLALVGGLYGGLFVWPTAWRYDRVGRTPVWTHRVTDQVEFLNIQGWQAALPPLDVRRRASRRSISTRGPAAVVAPCEKSSLK
jgi:hypothetical protein